jgi:poly(A) polymerase
VGSELITLMAQKLKLSKKEQLLAKKIVSMHMRPLQLFSLKQLSNRAYHRLFRDFGNETMEILVLALADMEAKVVFRGTEAELTKYREFIFDLLRMYINQPELIFPPKIISGQELINLYPQLPKPDIGKVLRALTMTQTLGQISTKEEALAWLGTYINKHYPRSAD